MSVWKTIRDAFTRGPTVAQIREARNAEVRNLVAQISAPVQPDIAAIKRGLEGLNIRHGARMHATYFGRIGNVGSTPKTPYEINEINRRFWEEYESSGPVSVSNTVAPPARRAPPQRAPRKMETLADIMRETRIKAAEKGWSIGLQDTDGYELVYDDYERILLDVTLTTPAAPGANVQAILPACRLKFEPRTNTWERVKYFTVYCNDRARHRQMIEYGTEFRGGLTCPPGKTIDVTIPADVKMTVPV